MKFPFQPWKSYGLARSSFLQLNFLLFLLSFFLLPRAHAQVDGGSPYNTSDHDKQIIGYVPNWDPWKGEDLGVLKGSLNHYNIDYSQYTILNFSFFGVANDGSLHSGDLRNKLIYKEGETQAPADLLHPDPNSSHDKAFVLGQPKTFWGWDEVLRGLGYEPNPDGAYLGWIKPSDGTSGAWPLEEYIEASMIKIAHENGVKVMASIGGWSMCKHFPEMAADPVKRARFLEDCRILVEDFGFDGIDLDWEYPGPFAGMNFTGTEADYHNFTVLVKEIRETIGPDRLISSAFSASGNKLQGLEWSELDKYMDYYNMMTYDFNGGWSNITGHNSPLYDYPGAEYPDFSLDATYRALVALNVNMSKVNLGTAFYGRAVITDGTPALGAPTKKSQVTFSVDGPVMSAADVTRFGVMEGTPYYTHLVDEIASGQWTEHWDDVAKVPYLTHKTANAFVGYDNERSIKLKAEYIKDRGLAGCIVWEAFSDWEVGPETKKIGKYPYCPATKAPLVNAINEVFAQGGTTNLPPVISFVSPMDGDVLLQDSLSIVDFTVDVTDPNDTVSQVSFTVNGEALTIQQTGDRYTSSFLPTLEGDYYLTVSARDTKNVQALDSILFTVSVKSDTVIDNGLITEALWNELFPYRFGSKETSDGWVLDPADDFFTYASFVDAMNQMGNIKAVLDRRCGTNAYVVTRIDKTTNQSIEIRHDEDFDAIQNADKEIVTIEVDYADFIQNGDLETRKRELAAFFANIAHETTGGWPTAPGGNYSWGLHFREEVGNPTDYRDETNVLYPPSPGKSYHGRGPMQLSWNYNYGQASEYLFGDKQVLLDAPEMLVEDASLAFQTAIWFWMTPQFPKPSAHDVMAGHWTPNAYDETKNRIPGLGMTVNIINGGIECGQGVEKSQVLDRIGYYERFTGIYEIGTDMDGVHDLSDCGCKDMSRYGGDTGDLTAEPCAQEPGVVFTSHADGDAVKLTPLGPVNVTLSIDTKTTALQNLTITVDGLQFSDSTFAWTPSDYGIHVLEAVASFADGSSASQSISLLIWDEDHVACVDVAPWSDTKIYNNPGNLVVYNEYLFENQYYAAPVDIPGTSAAWSNVKACSSDTTNQAPEVVWVSPTNGASIVQASLESITLQVEASDTEDGEPANGVSITVDNNTYSATKTGPYYEVTFTPGAYGNYEVTATAVDADSLSTSVVINFSVVESVQQGSQKIIGYLPTWIDTYDIKNDYRPESVTHVNISFLMFQQNNNDYNSADFASIAFDPAQLQKVDSVLTECNVLSKSQAAGTKVSVALGGATDYAFLWLMDRYYNDDAKMEEIATLIADYIASRGLDGIDLDMECFWADANISGTSDQGGRVRGSQWGDADQGPANSGTGLSILAQKLRAKVPNKLITAAVFATSWYGNNYDDTMAQSMDWIALMTYDFTGSWNDSPEGPHSSLYDLPLNTYPKQNANNPIYSADYALKYWMGQAPATWNHDGGFDVPANKLVLGVPMYGYDFSRSKPNGGNGVMYVPYEDILAEFPNAATSYDPLDPNALNGHVDGNGRDIYFDTPKQAAEKLTYSKDKGHQGVIVWELTQDVDYSNASSIMRALNEANTGGPSCFAVGGLSASDIQMTQATINWQSVGGVSSYTLGYKLSSDSQWTDQQVNGTNLTINNLSVHTSYDLRITYTCSDGSAAPYATQSFTTLSDVQICDAPTSLSASNVTKTSATISWNGTAPQYTLSYRLVGAETWQDQVVSTLSTHLTGLTQASNYEVSLVANCSDSNSTPVSITFETLDDISNGCAPAYSSYPSVYNTGDLVSYQGRNYECQVNNLYNVTPGTAAHWWKDLGACGDVPVCEAVTDFVVNSITTNSAQFSWSAVNGISNYTFEHRKVGDASWSYINVSNAAASLNGLSAGTNYEARVNYVCDNNDLAPYATLTFTTSDSTTTCNPVQSLTISGIEITSANSSWIGDATQYEVSYQVTGSNNWTVVTTNSASYSFMNLTAETNYDVSVVALCGSDQSTSVSTSFTTETDTGNGCAPAYEPYPAVYMSGDLVSYNGVNYECQADNLFNVTPGTAEHWWKTLGACSASVQAASTTTVYPVPNSTGTLNFNLESNQSASPSSSSRSVNIIDNSNNNVLSGTISDGNPSLDISSLAPGIYYVQIENEGSLIRIIVE